MSKTTKYKEEYVYQVEQACKNGFTTKQVAELFSVSASAIYSWRNTYPEFKKAMDAGRDVYNLATAETCLQKRLGGYFYNEITSRMVGVGADAKMQEVKVVKRHVPPDTNALKFFLKNRNKERWPDKQDIPV